MGGTRSTHAAFCYRSAFPRVAVKPRQTGKTMNRNVLIVAVIVLAGVAGFFAYQAYERDQNSLQIEVGPGGVKVDPPG